MDDETLKDISRPLRISFEVNKIPVDKFTLIKSDQIKLSNGWVCNEWSMLLKNWGTGSEHFLSIKYTLTEDIYDGKNKYPSGDYEQFISVNVE